MSEREPSGLQSHRPIRSFVRRRGRMTTAQTTALAAHWSTYGAALEDGCLTPAERFGRQARCVMDVGFGMGETLLTLAEQQPDCDFIGVDVYEAGVGAVLAEAHRRGLCNLKVFCADVMEVMAQCLPDASLDGVQLFFPDPWPKKRHHKRRLVQLPFLTAVLRVLKPGGRLHCATDSADYAAWILAQCEAFAGLENEASEGGFYVAATARPSSKYARRGQALGHGEWDTCFKRMQ